MRVIAIDPGPVQSGWVDFDAQLFRLHDFGLTKNSALVDSRLSPTLRNARLIAEAPKSYGNVIGDTVLQTCIWLGRFIQAANGEATLYTRKRIVSRLCHNATAGDRQVRQALIDRFPPTGAGRTPSIGTKAKPGPLYGVKGDIWAALAVAVVHADEVENLFL